MPIKFFCSDHKTGKKLMRLGVNFDFHAGNNTDRIREEYGP